MRAALLVATLAILMPLEAQQRADKIEFEVVSIKPADPVASGGSTRTNPGGFRGRNLRLSELIMSAWQVNRDLIIGGPSWLETAGWDIDARFPAGAGPAQMPQMFQAMLADRFHLLTHRETRVVPIYTLTVAKSGLKLQPGDGKGGGSAGPLFIRYASAGMRELAGQLSSYLGREVIDKTGLTGEYTINLRFVSTDPGDASSDAPSIFQALQDQAGLKLEATKGPVEVLVIDRAEKPTPN
jgi:uncharacterized protein (TIGR03435 family)